MLTGHRSHGAASRKVLTTNLLLFARLLLLFLRAARRSFICATLLALTFDLFLLTLMSSNSLLEFVIAVA